MLIISCASPHSLTCHTTLIQLMACQNLLLVFHTMHPLSIITSWEVDNCRFPLNDCHYNVMISHEADIIGSKQGRAYSIICRIVLKCAILPKSIIYEYQNTHVTLSINWVTANKFPKQHPSCDNCFNVS